MDFEPLIPNSHALTILGNYWPRKFDFSEFPFKSRYIQAEPQVKVLVETQRPRGRSRASLVLLHGLEGDGRSGYIVSLAYQALCRGYTVHRFHMRTCGGTEHLCNTLYHAGLTSDLLSFLEQEKTSEPVCLVGFSLGGNVALKAASESGGTLIQAACTVSAPIDLAACARALESRSNRLYQDRFVQRMKERLLRTGRYQDRRLADCRTIFDIDQSVTAPEFGFGDANHYYATQSALVFIPRIQVPVLMITAQDDTLIPFASYRSPAVTENPHVEVVAPRHGGHLGFISRRKPRFWADALILKWIDDHVAKERLLD